MDLNNIPLFQAVKKRLDWLTQRQEILAQNIANSDTPKYKPRDLKPYSFQDLVNRQRMQLSMGLTQANHMRGQPKRQRDFIEAETKKPYETAPDGNSVVLEEQMMKINETAIGHKLSNELYRKHMNMIYIALGKR